MIFPVLSLDPVVGAIAAGNAVVLKPSEVSPATSSLLAKYVEQYMDTSAVRIVEGTIPETSALLEQKWDKIFYTGLIYIYRLPMDITFCCHVNIVFSLGHFFKLFQCMGNLY